MRKLRISWHFWLRSWYFLIKFWLTQWPAPQKTTIRLIFQGHRNYTVTLKKKKDLWRHANCLCYSRTFSSCTFAKNEWLILSTGAIIGHWSAQELSELLDWSLELIRNSGDSKLNTVYNRGSDTKPCTASVHSKICGRDVHWWEGDT